jgi:hypothetical protein
MNGFCVALLIAAQPVVNASIAAVQKGTTNHHVIPVWLLIKQPNPTLKTMARKTLTVLVIVHHEA